MTSSKLDTFFVKRQPCYRRSCVTHGLVKQKTFCAILRSQMMITYRSIGNLLYNSYLIKAKIIQGRKGIEWVSYRATDAVVIIGLC